MEKVKVAVLMGGPSSEHDVSLASGKTIINTLRGEMLSKKYDAFSVVVTRQSEWIIGDGISKGFNEEQAVTQLLKMGTDVVFIAMHGEYGEDGTVQRILKDAGLCYTFAGVLPSALGMNKPLSLRLFSLYGLSVPEFVEVSKYEFEFESRKVMESAKKLGRLLLVKPANRGSSLGVTIASDPSALFYALKKAFEYSRSAMIMRYISGVEVTCGVLEDKTSPSGLLALPPIEIVPQKRAFFDYYSKYTSGASLEIIPPRLPDETIHAIQETAIKAHRIVGCSGASRTDMIKGEDGVLYVLEINTIPGMTPTSLLPLAAKARGISFPELLDRIITAALTFSF